MKRRHLFLGIILAGAILPQCAQAAKITADGTCTLAEAITAANTDTATEHCIAGDTGKDTIELTYSPVLSGAPLPEITTEMVINGNGNTVDANKDAAVGRVLTVATTGNLTLNETTVTGGLISGNGGGIYNSGILTVIDSTISANTSYGAALASYGGGINNYRGGTLTLTNSTISGNKSDFGGGGICIWPNSTAVLTNCTVSGNTSYYGGGIAIGGAVPLHSSIISGNMAEVGNEVYNEYYGTITVDSYNVFGHSGATKAQALYGFTVGGSNVNATSDGGLAEPPALSAILSPLADNGGPTLTYALPEGSLAIDLDKECSGLIDTKKRLKDQRNYLRPIGDGCDAGSFEFGSKPIRKDMPWIKVLLL